MSNTKIVANPGSFRDPVNRVYETFDSETGSQRILRGLNSQAFDDYKKLALTVFFKKSVERSQIIGSKILDETDADAKVLYDQGWAGVLEHEKVPFISYPYEWSFSMLKDAALLQLMLIEKALKNGWTLKDATPFNIQFIGSKPIFIDLPSFQQRQDGESWVGYRQFCSLFLIPLMLKSYLGIDHLTLLRSNIDGLPPTEAVKYFRGGARFKKGVMGHVVFPAKVEKSIASKERDGAVAQKRGARYQSDAMVIGLVQSLIRLVKSLSIKIDHTDWSKYDQTHSYADDDYEAKKAFVEEANGDGRDVVWDIGSNTGTFSKICAKGNKLVVSIDGDHNAIEQLYLAEKKQPTGVIVPIVQNLSNISPNHGWAGVERLALDNRKKPDLVLCLALIHHIRISANIPIGLFLKWLHSLEADIVLEFVDRHDEMVVKLLTNKEEQYEDYNKDSFVENVNVFFDIEKRLTLKGGKREIFLLSPKK